MYDIMHLPGVIELGYVGEKNFREISFDLRPWLRVMPEGVGSIIHIRPGETASDAYIAATTFADGILTWTPTDGDLGTVEGYGQIQIWLEEEENDSIVKRGKSAKVQTFVQGAVNEASSETPEPQEAWINQMTALKVATVNAAEDAEDAKDDAVTAKEAAEDAQSAAEAAQDAAEEAQGKAEDAQDAAETAQGKAEDAQTAAETAQANAEAAIAKYPRIASGNGNWETYNPGEQEYQDTGVHAKGDTGEVPDIQVGTVTTLLPGEQATVTRRSGSPDEAPVFDFGIPKGDTGQAENIYGNTIDMSEHDSTKVATEIGKKANKVTSATNGNFAALDSNGDLTDSGKKAADFKPVQTAVTDPSASGTTDEFISGITQDANGVISPSKKTVQDATQSAHGLMSSQDKTKLDNVSLCTRRKVALAVAVGDWTLSGSVYMATFLTAYVTTTSDETLVIKEPYDQYAVSGISLTKKSGGGGVVLTTDTIPTGTITGTLVIIDDDDGNIPLAAQQTAWEISEGGTGETSVAGVRSAFGIPDVVDNLTTNDGTKALSAKQGKLLNDQIGTDSLETTAQTLTGAINEVDTNTNRSGKFSSTSNPNTITIAGTYRFNANTSNVPSGLSSSVGFIHHVGGSDFAIQFARGYYPTDDSGAIYARYKGNNSFSSWSKIN